jgi:hypothetical protein
MVESSRTAPDTWGSSIPISPAVGEAGAMGRDQSQSARFIDLAGLVPELTDWDRQDETHRG